MVLVSEKRLSIFLTGISTGLIAASSNVSEPLPRAALIGVGSLCAMLSIYFQYEKDTSGRESTDPEENYMRGLREGVKLGKEITESGGSIPPSLQSDTSETQAKDDFESEFNK